MLGQSEEIQITEKDPTMVELVIKMKVENTKVIVIKLTNLITSGTTVLMARQTNTMKESQQSINIKITQADLCTLNPNNKRKRKNKSKRCPQP